MTRPETLKPPARWRLGRVVSAPARAATVASALRAPAPLAAVLGVFAVGALAFACAVPTASAAPDFVFDAPVTAVLHDPSSGSTYVAGSFREELPRTGGGVPVVANGHGALDADSFAHLAGTVLTAVSDGVSGWYVGGEFKVAGAGGARNLVHVMGDGSIDPAWRPNPNGPVSAIAVAGSTLYAGGEFTVLGGASRASLGAVDLDVGLARAWDPGLSGGRVDALLVSDQVLYVGGRFSSVGGMSRPGLAAIARGSGAPTAWNPEPNGPVWALAMRGETLFVGGEFSRVGGVDRELLAALDSDSGEPTGWDAHLANVDSHSVGSVRAIAVSGSTLYVGGRFTEAGGEPRTSLAGLDASSAAVIAWHPVLESAEGIAGGSVFAIDTLGSRVYVGGAFGYVGGVRRRAVAALDSGSGALTDWDPHPDTPAEIHTVSVSDLFVYVGGTLSGAGAPLAEVAHLAKLGAGGDIDRDWKPDPDGVPLALALAGGRLYVGGGFSSIGGETRWGLASLDPLTGEATDWDPRSAQSDGWWDPAGPASVTALAVEGSTVYAAGGFSELGGAQRRFLGAVDASSGEATAWDPAPNHLVYALVAHGATIYAGGPFTSIGGAPRRHLAALDSLSGAARAWSPDPDNQVTALAVAGFDVYVGGYFSTIGGAERSGLAAVDALTGTAMAWDPSPSSHGPFATVTELKVVGPRVYLAGGFDRVGGEARQGLAAVNRTSGRVLGWNPRPPAPELLAALDATRSTVYVGGQFPYMDDVVLGGYGELPSGIAPVGGGAGGAPGPACGPAVVLYGVRGSRGAGEPVPPSPGDETVGRLLGTLEDLLTAAGITHESKWVPYPAARADSVGSYTSGEMQSSLGLGVTALTEAVLADAAACPATHFALVGYSQGAWVIRDVLPVLADRAGRIDAVALIADPALDGSDRNVAFHGPGISSGEGMAFATRGVASALAPAVPAELAGKVDSYCRERDIVCRGAGANTLDSHSQYRNDVPPYLTWAANRVAALVRNAEEAAAAADAGDAGGDGFGGAATVAAGGARSAAAAGEVAGVGETAAAVAADEGDGGGEGDGNDEPGPVADLAAPAAARPGQAVEVSATGSQDPEGGALRYQWDLDGDGVYEASTARPFVVRSFALGEGGRVGLRVLDEAGRIGQAGASVAVSEDAVDLPGAPTGLLVVPRPGGLDLSWEPPAQTGGAPLVGYLVRDGEGAVVAIADAATSVSLDGLEVGRSYSFTVAAYNTAYEGRPSAASTPVLVPAAGGGSGGDGPGGEGGPGGGGEGSGGDGTEGPADNGGGSSAQATGPRAAGGDGMATGQQQVPGGKRGGAQRAKRRLTVKLLGRIGGARGAGLTVAIGVRNAGSETVRGVRVALSVAPQLRRRLRMPPAVALRALAPGRWATARLRIAPRSPRPRGSHPTRMTVSVSVRASGAQGPLSRRRFVVVV